MGSRSPASLTSLRALLACVVASVAACGLDLRGEEENELAAAPADAGSDEEAAVSERREPDAPDGSIETDAAEPEAPSPGFALALSNGAYVDVGALPIPDSFTLEAWIRPRAIGKEQLVVAKDQNNKGAGQFRLGLDTKGRPFFIMSDAGGSEHGLYSKKDYALRASGALPIDVWSHVAVTKSQADFALLVDGATVSEVQADEAFVHGVAGLSFRIGARVDKNGTSASDAFDGDIDEVRLWTVARDVAAISGARATPIAPTDPAFANLGAYYRFDEGAGTTAADARGAFPGTLVASPTWIVSTAF